MVVKWWYMLELITIYKRKSIYYVEYLVNGERFKKSLKATNLKEAFENFKEFEKMYLEISINKPLKLIEALNIYVNYHQNILQQSYLRDFKYRIQYISKYLNNPDINSINQNSLIQFVNNMLTRKAAIKTINNYLSVINSLYDFLEKQDIQKKCFDISKLWLKKQKGVRYNILTYDEIKLLNNFISSYDPAIIEIIEKYDKDN